MIDKQSHARAFKEGDSPAIFVFIRTAASCCKAGKAKHDIGGSVAIHAQQLAHDRARSRVILYQR